MRFVSLVALLPLAVLSACDAGGDGTVEVSAWAEDTPAEGMVTDDGWTVTFDHWLTAIADLHVVDPDTEARVAGATGAFVADWVQVDAPAPLASFEAPSGRPLFGFAVLPPTDPTPVGDVDPALVDELVAGGWSHLVIGRATRGDEARTFRWGFDLGVALSRCQQADGTTGLPVASGEATPAVITLHADHLLWDRLGTEEADLRFDALAQADADADGAITAEELAAVDLVDAGYEALGLPIDDLWSFLRHSLAIAPHLDGDGLCRVQID